ncbi:MAG: aminopeptidase [Candidatus Woesebacteria bacterium]
MDLRYTRLANLLLTYSIEAKHGEHIWIRASGLESLKLGREVYREALKLGAHPYLDITDETLSPSFFALASDHHLTEPAKIEEFIVNWADKIVTLVGEDNTRALSDINPEKLVLKAQTKKKVRSTILTKPWVLTWVPTHSTAQDAGMSLDDFETFYFDATLRDWKKEGQAFTKLATRLNKGKEVEIVGAYTHLTMSIANRIWIPDNGECNMPGGEVFTAPIEDSVEGHVYFEFPVLRLGKLMRDIRLTFEKGVVTKATATENEDFLHTLLDQDKGARKLGELAIGLNKGVTRFMYNTLFDEKMAGTIHMALGEAYEECGGKNKSHLHMDMVKEMRTPGSKFLVDGKIVLEAGKLL